MKIVQIPSKVWVGTYEYALSLVARDDPDLGGDSGATHFDEDNRRILIAIGLPTRTRFEVVWHELTHAINDLCDIDDPMPEEELVSMKHGAAWTQFFLDNPRFVAWWNYTIERIQQDQKGEPDGNQGIEQTTSV